MGAISTPTHISSGVFGATPGVLTLALAPNNGTVLFDPTTSIVEKPNTPVPSKNTGNTLSFTVQQGRTYLISALYALLPPNSTGTLRDNSPNSISLCDVGPLANPQLLEVRG
jgi:hypothetical protein